MNSVRITLRLPPDLHRRLIETAKLKRGSLNKQIVDLLEDGLHEDFYARLVPLPEGEWLDEVKAMRAESQRRYDEAERAIKLMWLEKADLKNKKGAA